MITVSFIKIHEIPANGYPLYVAFYIFKNNSFQFIYLFIYFRTKSSIQIRKCMSYLDITIVLSDIRRYVDI